MSQPGLVYGAANVTGQLAIGYASSAVGDKANEDCFGVVTPREMSEAAERGSVIALADGGSAGGNGRVASELTVRTLSVSYTHLTLPTTLPRCSSRWSPYQ